MRRTAVLIVAALAAALLLSSSPAPAGAGAGATTNVYVVHGLNLEFQDAQDAGGTAVTVCSGAATLIPDFQFGDVVGPVPLPTGQATPVQVYSGADIDCAAPADAELLIDDIITPTGATFSVVATSFGDQVSPELIVGEIDTSCVEPGTGGAVAVHAANAPEVDVFSTDRQQSVGTLVYDESIALELPAGTYGIEVYIVDGPTDPILALDLPVTAETVTVGYVVGNQPVDGNTPVVLLAQVIPVELCAQPAPPAAAPAAAAAAAPTFTG